MALVFDIKVVPSSGKFSVVKDKKGELKCFLKSAPENGDANRELIKELSKLLRLPHNDLEIIMGLTSRKKKIKIHASFTNEQLCIALGIVYQNICLPLEREK